MTIHYLNPHEREWQRKRWALWFGACAPTIVIVHGHLDDAIETVAEWAEEHAPGLLYPADMVNADYNEAVTDGLSEEKAWEHATADVMCLDQGRYMLGYEWGVLIEDPTRDELMALPASYGPIEAVEV